MNVLVIMCDSLRHDVLACDGNTVVATPNIDRLAGKSVRFRNCFTQSPVCAPARHTLATGRYPLSHGVLTNSHDAPRPLQTIAHAVRTLGYRRFQVGTMHWKSVFDTGYEPAIAPRIDKTLLSERAIEAYEWETNRVTMMRTGGPSPRQVHEYRGFQVAEGSVRSIEDAVRNGQQFLNWTTFFEPHAPFYPPREFYAAIDQDRLSIPSRFWDPPPAHPTIAHRRREWEHLTEVEIRQMTAGYFGMIQLADSFVGKILDCLDRNSLWENTMVVFTTDHGEQLGEHGLFHKSVMREGSVHIPLMIYHPQIAPGQRTQFVELVDVFPTICDFLDLDLPATVQGSSLRPLLESDQTPDGWRTSVFSELGNIKMIRTENWKLNLYDGVPGELFCLSTDPNEYENRIEDEECQDAVVNLMELLRRRVRS